MCSSSRGSEYLLTVVVVVVVPVVPVVVPLYQKDNEKEAETVTCKKESGSVAGTDLGLSTLFRHPTGGGGDRSWSRH